MANRYRAPPDLRHSPPVKAISHGVGCHRGSTWSEDRRQAEARSSLRLPDRRSAAAPAAPAAAAHRPRMEAQTATFASRPPFLRSPPRVITLFCLLIHWQQNTTGHSQQMTFEILLRLCSIWTCSARSGRLSPRLTDVRRSGFQHHGEQLMSKIAACGLRHGAETMWCLNCNRNTD